MTDFLSDRLACPACGGDLDGDLACGECGATYDRTNGIYDLVYDDGSPLDGLGDAAAEAGEEITQDEYEQYVSDEDLQARETAGRALREPLGRVSGTVLDLATGMAGGLFAPLLEPEDVTPIASDVSADVLDRLQEEMPETDRQHAYVACNARALPFSDGALDAVVTAGGLNNVTDTGTALDELYRVVDETGEFLGMNLFVDAESESAERALELGVETAYVEDEFRRAAVDAGFETVEILEVASAEAAENPYDLMPVAGDEQTYAIVRLDPESGTESSLENQLGQRSLTGRQVGRKGPM